MTNSAGGTGDVFDIRRIRRLVELMNEHDLSEVDLRQADVRIRLRRGAEPVVAVAPTRAAEAVAFPGGATPPASSSGRAAADDSKAVFVKSPMVGTFYAASSPDSAPFVKVGDHVGATTTVCVIEAMKVFNEIPAEVSGQITAILVENGESVEYGQPLFKVFPSG